MFDLFVALFTKAKPPAFYDWWLMSIPETHF
jgi:hypothetical protein